MRSSSSAHCWKSTFRSRTFRSSVSEGSSRLPTTCRPLSATRGIRRWRRSPWSGTPMPRSLILACRQHRVPGIASPARCTRRESRCRTNTASLRPGHPEAEYSSCPTVKRTECWRLCASQQLPTSQHTSAWRRISSALRSSIFARRPERRHGHTHIWLRAKKRVNDLAKRHKPDTGRGKHRRLDQ